VPRCRTFLNELRSLQPTGLRATPLQSLERGHTRLFDGAILLGMLEFPRYIASEMIEISFGIRPPTANRSMAHAKAENRERTMAR
jgi:hypothetical protein